MSEKDKKTEEEKDQDFLDAYNKLCEEHKRSLGAIPGWRFSSDGNDYRVVIQMQVQRRLKEDDQLNK